MSRYSNEYDKPTVKNGHPLTPEQASRNVGGYIAKSFRSFITRIRKFGKILLSIRPKDIIGNIRQAASSVHRYFKNSSPAEVFNDVTGLLSHWFKSAKKYVNKNWKHRMVVVVLTFSVITLGFFRFYIISPTHIYKLAEHNYVQSQDVLNELTNLKNKISMLQTTKSPLNDTSAAIATAEQKLTDYKPKHINSTYASWGLKNMPDGISQIKLLENDDPKAAKKDYQSDLNDIHNLYRIIADVTDYQTDADLGNALDYADVLKNAIKGLDESNISAPDVELKQIRKWLETLLAETQEYSLTGDTMRFKERQKDFSAELIKELESQSLDVLNHHLKTFSELVSDYESIVFYLKPGVKD